MNTEQEAIESKERLSKIEQQIEYMLTTTNTKPKDLNKVLDKNMLGDTKLDIIEMLYNLKLKKIKPANQQEKDNQRKIQRMITIMLSNMIT